MAFRDENGKITIDEVVAQNDIKHITVAQENLESALSLINQINVASTEFSGKTGRTIETTSAALIRQMRALTTQMEETSTNIDYVVKKYQAIDKQLKETVENFGV